MTATTETAGSEASPTGGLATSVRWLCIGLSTFQLWAIFVATLDPLLHRALFLSMVLCLVFLTAAADRSQRGPRQRMFRILSWFWVVSSLAAGMFFLARFEWIRARWPQVELLPLAGMVCGLVLLFAVLDATRRIIGWLLFAVIMAFLVYALAGHLMTGLFYHRLLTLEDVIDQIIFTTNGLFSAPIAVAATYVYVFVLFGTALEVSGAGDFIFRLASSLAGRTRGGPAKVAVASSALYGTITGSPTSNVVTTGLFTIPMMKRAGLRGDVAAAVEAVASTGGGLLPPVMGSAAFLMVELTGIPYLEICLAALFPAMLFYLSIFMQLHWGAGRLGIDRVPAVAHSFWAVLREGAHHLVPLLTLVLLLAGGSTPITAAGAALVLTVAVSWIRPDTRMGLKRILQVLELGARRSMLVTVACAAAGLVVGAIAVTGLGGKVSSLIFAYAGGSMFLALFATMIVCLLLGMGMPVPSAYVLTAVLAGPPLAMLGLPELSAHLFILYFAVLSAITPPVAVAAYAAASIAEENPGRVAAQAVRLGLVAFVIPYFFVYRPELLLVGSPLSILLALLTSAAGVILLASALEGFMQVSLVWQERMLMLASGLCLIFPGWGTDVAGVVLGVLAVSRQSVRARTQMSSSG